MNEEKCGKKNTDKLLWVEDKDDPFSPSIHITEDNGIGINVGGKVIVLPIREIHKRLWKDIPLKKEN